MLAPCAVLPPAPEGFHWECFFLPMSAPPPPSEGVCCATLKASEGATPQCRHRSCFDLAERNVRLWQMKLIGPERFAALSKDLGGHCRTAHQFQQYLLSQPAAIGPRWQRRSKTKKYKPQFLQWFKA